MADQITAQVTFYREQRTVPPAALRDRFRARPHRFGPRVCPNVLTERPNPRQAAAAIARQHGAEGRYAGTSGQLPGWTGADGVLQTGAVTVDKPAHQAQTDQQCPGLCTVGVEVAEGIFTAGLALEDAAAVAADPLVRGRIEKAISALDDVIRVVRGAAFGTEDDGGFPGQLTVAGHEHDRRVRYWLGEGESALDVATTALSRAGELEQGWPDRFGSDAGVLRGKLAILREAMNSH